jgi:O-glycosyl hydrolase
MKVEFSQKPMFRMMGSLLLIILSSGPILAAGPVIADVSSSGISKSSVLITWSTDIPSDSQVEYGVTPAYGSNSSDANLVTAHSLQLDGLTPLTLYHYRAISSDGSGNVSESQDFIFFLVQLAWDAPGWDVGRYLVSYGNASRTYSPPPIDVGTSLTYTISISSPGEYYFAAKAELAPGFESQYSNEVHLPVETEATFIFSIEATNISANQATITWITDPAADSQIEYGTTTAYDNFTDLDPAYVLNHSQVLSDLSDGTTYHFRAKSRSASGIPATSGDFYFTTPDITPPNISEVTASETTSSSITIDWATNEPSESQVQWSLSAYIEGSTDIDWNLVTSHSQTITGLEAGTSYKFSILSRDASGNLGSSIHTFTTVADGEPVHAVDWNDQRQQIDGYGASSYWLYSTGLADLTDSQADMFFSADKGIGLSLLRNIITPAGDTDALSDMKKAQSRGARIWSVPFSPEASWKDNGDVSNGGALLASRYQSYADRLASYAVDMKTQGVDLYALSVQNEPNTSGAYESCLWDPQQLHDFVPLLYDALAAEGVSSTRILMPEASAWQFDLASDTLADLNTASKVSILAAHDYGNSPSPVDTNGKPLWQTEIASFDAFDGSMENALRWAVHIHKFMTIAEANAWHYLWLIPNDADNSGLTDQSGNPAKRMWAIGNFSKFVRPGYYRVGATSYGGVLTSAYKAPDNSRLVIVAINLNDATVSRNFSINASFPSNVTPWITSTADDLAAKTSFPVGDPSFAYELPASSVTTFVMAADTTAPVIGDVNDVTVEATSLAGAVVSFSLPTATDDVDAAPAVSAIPASGSVFALGSTTVTVTAMDASGNSSTKTFTVTVVDTTRPGIGELPDLTAEATSPNGAIVTFAPVVTDNADPAPVLSVTPASGSTFPLGPTPVMVKARDKWNNESTKTFTVTVVDTTRPVIGDLPNLTVEATSPVGAVVIFAPVVTDNADPAPVVNASPASGSTFALGSVTVTVTATDASGNSSTKTFDVLVVKSFSDLNYDGKADILWRNSSTGQIHIWYMDGSTQLGCDHLVTVPDQSWKIAGIADFNHDRKPDILWRNISTGQNYAWFMNGTDITGGAYLLDVPDVSWMIAGVTDFNNDGNPDILWRNISTGQNYAWFMSGTTRVSGAYLIAVPDLNWKIAGLADFNKDGNRDILWRNSATGENYVWFMDGTGMAGGTYLDSVPNPNWKIVSVGDYNGDGQADVLWRNCSTGENYLWFMNGATRDSGAYLDRVADSNWLMFDKGEDPIGADFDNNGTSDLLWRNEATGENYGWFMDGIKSTGGFYLYTVQDPNWKIAGLADFNGDGRVDILWRNISTGANYVWFMNEATFLSGAYLIAVPNLNWKIAATGDFNKDGKADVLWRNLSSGENYIWFMDGETQLDGAYLTAVEDPWWRIAGTGDFNRDGKIDILWRNVTTGVNYVWFMDGVTMAGVDYMNSMADLNWKAAATGDFNKDGNVDILWRNETTGETYVWYMNGITCTGGDYIQPAVSHDWRIAPNGDY